MTDRAKLHLINNVRSESHPQIINALLSALEYARKNKVSSVEVNIKSDKGHWYTKGTPHE